MMKTLNLIVLLLILLSTDGCVTREADLSAISTKAVNVENFDLDNVKTVGQVKGDDTRFLLLFIPIPLGNPTLENAVTDALNKSNSDLLIDATVYRKAWWFLIGQVGVEIEGTAVRTKEAK